MRLMKLVVVVTVEPPSKGHFWTNHFVICREAVLFSEVENLLHIHFEGYGKCPLYKGCPFLGGPFITGLIVLTIKQEYFFFTNFIFRM